MVTKGRPTPFEMADGMKKYLEELRQKPNKEASKMSLIRTGVLDSNGNPKKQICTGGYYIGR